MDHEERLKGAYEDIYNLIRIYKGNLLVMDAKPYADKAMEAIEYLRGYIKGQEVYTERLLEQVMK